MKFQHGNQYWRERVNPGRPRIFQSPEEMWERCCEYFQWVEEHPLQEEKLFAYQGEVTRETISKMRAMTISQLCFFLEITEGCWSTYRKRDDFLWVITRVEQIIYNQKFQGASADLLNPNIIARDLGLADKKELTGKDGGPIELSDQELESRIRTLENELESLKT